MTSSVETTLRGPEAYSLSRRVIDEMEAAGVWPTPLNFELWLHYLGDPDGALGRGIQRILAAEEAFRKLERSACAAHIARVVAADPASIAVSALHLDLLADLAEMNARLCGFARFFLELHEAGPMDCGVPAKPVTPAMHALEESSD